MSNRAIGNIGRVKLLNKNLFYHKNMNIPRKIIVRKFFLVVFSKTYEFINICVNYFSVNGIDVYDMMGDTLRPTLRGGAHNDSQRTQYKILCSISCSPYDVLIERNISKVKYIGFLGSGTKCTHEVLVTFTEFRYLIK